MEDERQRIVSDENFVDSVRYQGLTTIDAVNEFIDNSFDAECKNVWITIGENDEGNLYLIIEDDGEGIPSEKLRNILSFGGRLERRSNTTGRFGWGLSASACCQTLRTNIYSKYKEEDDFYYNYIDIDELKENNGFLPETQIKTLPFEEYNLNLESDAESGTILILENLDDPDRKTVDGLEKIIKKNVARVHRKIISNDKNIYVNGERVHFRDPLMLMDGFKGSDKCEKAEDYADIEPILFEDIKDKNGEPAKVKIKIAKLPVEKIKRNKLQGKFNIGIENQGFYIIRHGREIAGGLSLKLYTKHNDYNYFRGEISFPPALDDKFGIQNNKSRFSLDEDLREKLEEKFDKVRLTLKKDIIDERTSVDAEEQNKDAVPTTSERIALNASDKLPPSGYNPSKEEHEKEKEELEKEKKKRIEEIEEDDTIPEDKKQEKINQIKSRFQKERNFQRVIDVIGTGEFYKMKHKGNRIDVIINQSHDFYKKIYEKATQNPELQTYLDLFLFTLAQAEDQYYSKKEVKKFYESQRREWSAIMSTFLEEAEDEMEK